MIRPTREFILMKVACEISQRSTCNRLKVGAVLAKDWRIISTGYNGSPSGMPHCPDDEQPGCDRTVHAEANAIVFAARNGIATEGATLYTTYSPCMECAKLIINAGISTIYFQDYYRLTEGVDYLMKAGIETIWTRYTI